MNDLIVKQLIGGTPDLSRRLEWWVTNFRFRMSQATNRLREGKITLAEFQSFGRDELRDTYYGIAETGKGARLTPKEMAQVRVVLREQIGYWDRFCQDIADQRQALFDQGLEGLEEAYASMYDKFDRRAQSYAGAIEAEGARWAMAGLYKDGSWFQWVRSPVESCDTCIERDGGVWQMKDGRLPFYPRDGNSECLYNCLCRWQPISKLKALALRALGKLKRLVRRKSFEEIAEEWLLEKGGKGSGWHAPPRGTHVAGAKAGAKGKAGRLTKQGEKKIREIEGRVLAHMPLREAGYVFDANGKRILQKEASSNAPYELKWEDDEIAKMKDAVFTHNHPLTGGSFSISDVAFAMRADLSEIRAIGTGPGISGKTHLYKLARLGEGWGKQEGLQEQIGHIDKEVGDRLWAQVKEGKLSPDRAEFAHNHNVMQALASANGWEYTREEL